MPTETMAHPFPRMTEAISVHCENALSQGASIHYQPIKGQKAGKGSIVAIFLRVQGGTDNEQLNEDIAKERARGQGRSPG